MAVKERKPAEQRIFLHVPGSDELVCFADLSPDVQNRIRTEFTTMALDAIMESQGYKRVEED